MAITDDIRKTLSDPTPLYFVAGTADLAVQQAKKVPALLEKLEAEAPAKFDAGLEAVRTADPKQFQEKATARAKEAQETLQAKLAEVFGTLDTDVKKFGESAQGLALRGVGVAAEYAVKAKETYEKVAEHGEQAVRTWRGESAAEAEEPAAVTASETESETEKSAAEPVAVEDEAKADAAAKKPAAKKTAPKTTATTAKKTTTAKKSGTPSAE
ncbi:hypothetical protein [Streptomyces sp. NPDC002851]